MPPQIDALVPVALLPAGVFAAIAVHEVGHALCGLVAGVGTMVLSVGRGPLVLRFRLGSTWLFLRCWPLSGFVIHDQQGSRAARLLRIAGGPLANIVVAAALTGAALRADDDVAGRFGMLAAIQWGIGLTALLPRRIQAAGKSIGSDGSQIIDALFRPSRNAPAQAYAEMLRPFVSPGGPDHPETRHAMALMYHAGRLDRWTEPWAERDMIEGMTAALDAQDLTPAERAFADVACVEATITCGHPGGDHGRLDAWSSEALSLVPCAATRVARGAALVACGHASEGWTTLLEGASAAQAAPEPLSGELGLLLHLSLGRAADAIGREVAGRGDTAGATAWREASVGQLTIALRLVETLPRRMARAVLRRLRMTPLPIS